jgi:hypothetical protein
VVAAERRADEAERRVAANLASKAGAVEQRASMPSALAQPKPATPKPAARHTPKEIPVMSTRKQAILRDLESASSHLAIAKQSLEDAEHLARAGFASDTMFATHVVAGSVNEWNQACAAYLCLKG